MNDLNIHFRLLLGLDAAWEVQNVDLDLEAKQSAAKHSHASMIGGVTTTTTSALKYLRALILGEHTLHLN